MKRALIGLLVFVLAAGCSDDDDPIKPKVPSGPSYPPRTTPERSLDYYRLAWQDRDSTRIDSVLADDYQGTSTDVGATTETLSFLKSDEIRAIHGMNDDVNLTSVVVDFGPSSSWIRDTDPGDPPEWVVLRVPNATILLQSVTGADLAVSPHLTDNEFKLKPVAMGADTTWQVVRWEEVHTNP